MGGADNDANATAKSDEASQSNNNWVRPETINSLKAEVTIQHDEALAAILKTWNEYVIALAEVRNHKPLYHVTFSFLPCFTLKCCAMLVAGDD